MSNRHVYTIDLYKSWTEKHNVNSGVWIIYENVWYKLTQVSINSSPNERVFSPPPPTLSIFFKYREQEFPAIDFHIQVNTISGNII